VIADFARRDPHETIICVVNAVGFAGFYRVQPGSGFMDKEMAAMPSGRHY
jgi:hypothetical protein